MLWGMSSIQKQQRPNILTDYASGCHGCLCYYACPFAFNDPVLHAFLWLLDSESRSAESLSYAHSRPRMEARLAARHPGRTLGKCHEDDKLILHPAHAPQPSAQSLSAIKFSERRICCRRPSPLCPGQVQWQQQIVPAPLISAPFFCHCSFPSPLRLLQS